MAQLLPGAAASLDRVAVGAQRDHLLRVVRAALGEILDVVHIQDRPSGIGDVLRLTRTARVLAVPFAAQQHGTARRLQAQDVHAYPRLAEPGAATGLGTGRCAVDAEGYGRRRVAWTVTGAAAALAAWSRCSAVRPVALTSSGPHSRSAWLSQLILRARARRTSARPSAVSSMMIPR